MRASRRDLLLIALAAALRPAPAAAQAKVTKAEARYQPAPRDGQSCALCTLFRPPHACTVVEGDIVPTGWCKFFAIPD